MIPVASDQAPLTDARVLAPTAIAGGLALVLFLWAAGWTGPDAGSRAIDAIYVLLTSLPWALLWLGGAAGFGIGAQHLLGRWIELDGALRLATGVAVLLFVDAALGSLGWMQIAGIGAGAWVVTAFGLALLLWRVARARKQSIALRNIPPGMLVAAAPAAAILLLAACSAPGWLWNSEFGGYDALSYHLELPKEWFHTGAIAPLQHNVYSFLPGYMEAAYYHLMALRGEPLDALSACQMLHAGLAVLTAAATARLTRGLIADDPHSSVVRLGGFAAAIALGTPWIVVVASLAYNEMPTALMLASGLIVIIERRGSAAARALLLGLFMAVAVACKLTSAGFVAAPLLVAAIWYEKRRVYFLTIAAAAALIVLLPWLLRNCLHAGNPTFPFLSGVFGSAHFSGQQIAIWNDAHRAAGSIGYRLTEAFAQLFRYGIGTSPDETGREPWQAQWSILPWLAIAGGLFALTSRQLGRAATMMLVIIVVQVLFWMLFTHIKSRFMLPMVVPGAAAMALGMARLGVFYPKTPGGKKLFDGTLFFTALAWCVQPAIIYQAQRDGAPSAHIGDADLLSGKNIAPGDVDAMAAVLPTVAINRQLDAGARVLFVGESAPLYYESDKITYTTVWDRGVMSRVIAEHPDDPHQWMSSLKAEGFTHALFDPVMLSIWQESGWADPALDPLVLQHTFDHHSELIAAFPNGQRLYHLP